MASRSIFAAISVLLATTACGSAPEPEQGKVATDSGNTTQRLRPGLWRQAAADGTPFGEARCIAAEEAMSANGSEAHIRELLTAQATRDGCTVQSITITGPTIAWTQMCSGASLTMTTDHRGDRTTTTITGGGTPPMTTHSTRVGDC